MAFRILFLFLFLFAYSNLGAQEVTSCTDTQGSLFSEITYIWNGKVLGEFSTEEHWASVQNQIPYEAKVDFSKELHLGSNCQGKWLVLPLIRYPHHWIWDNQDLGEIRSESVVYLTPGAHTLKLTIDNRKLGSNQTKAGIRSKFFYFNQFELIKYFTKKVFSFVIESFVLLFIGIFFLFFFIQRRKDKAPLFLACFCFSVSIYSAITSVFVYSFFPFISYTIKFRLEASLEILFHLIHGYLMFSFFPSVFEKIWLRVLWMPTILLISFFLIAPEPSMSIFYKYSLILHPILGTIVLIRMFKALTLRLLFAKPVFMGLLILIPSIFQDSWSGFSTNIELLPYTFPIALLFLILLHSLLLAKKFSLAEQEAEQKSMIQEQLQKEKRDRKNEKETIVRKLHDELGSDLDLVLQSSQNNDKEFMIKKIQSFLVRFKALVLTVRSSSNDERNVLESMRSHIKRLEALGKYSVEFETNLDKDCLDIWQKEHLLAIFYEVITNINKYDKITKMKIRLIQRKDSLYFSLFTDGKGFSEKDIAEALLKNSSGLGLENIQYRVITLHGKKRQMRLANGGFFFLEFPLNT
jgi:signal transduction histidine kinase